MVIPVFLTLAKYGKIFKAKKEVSLVTLIINVIIYVDWAIRKSLPLLYYPIHHHTYYCFLSFQTTKSAIVLFFFLEHFIQSKRKPFPFTQSCALILRYII